MGKLSSSDLSLVVRRMPKDVRTALYNNPGALFVGGGFIRAVVANEEVNDIDFFGPSGALRHVAEKFEQERKDVRKLVTKNAITIVTPGRSTLQFITRWAFDEPDDVVASFDFTVCQAVVWFDGKVYRSVVGDRFYEDLAAKRLSYTSPVREEEAGGSMLRVIKYVKRGYRIQMGDLGQVIGRIFSEYRPDGPIDFAQYAVSRMQEVDPLTVIDGIPVDDDEEVEGLVDG